MSRLVKPAGLVVAIDRVTIEKALFNDWQRTRRRLDPNTSGTYVEHLAELAEGGDRPSTLEDHIGWMKMAGLAACCLHLYGDRAMLVGRKLGRDQLAVVDAAVDLYGAAFVARSSTGWDRSCCFAERPRAD